MLKSIANEDGIKPGDSKKGAPEGGFDLDSDDNEDEFEDINIDMNFLDEKTGAIHCLGNLALNCPKLMYPHLETSV